MACFYSARPQLSKIFSFYLWSMSIAEDRRLVVECSPRLCGGISLISWQFFPIPNIRTQYYGLTKESPWLHEAYFDSRSSMREVLYFLNFTIFKTFCDARCRNKPIDLWWMNGELRVLNKVSRFVAHDRENFKNNNRILTYDGCFWFHRVANAKERTQEHKLLRDSHVHCHETQSVHKVMFWS